MKRLRIKIGKSIASLEFLLENTIIVIYTNLLNGIHKIMVMVNRLIAIDIIT